MIKRISFIFITVFLLLATALYAKITPEKIEEIRKEYIEGLQLLENLDKESKEELIEILADNLVKLWVLEHSNIEDGTFKLYIDASDIFIDNEGNIYIKAESTGYIEIGTAEYNLKGKITLINKIDAYQKYKKEVGFDLAARFGGSIFTNFNTIDFDILFGLQIFKIKKINIGLSFGTKSAGINCSYSLTNGFNIGLLMGIAYPRNSNYWKPALGVQGTFKF